MSQNLSGDRGETLIELLISIVIMGVAVVAIFESFSTTILVSGAHRKQATAGAYVRDYAEFLENTIATPNGYKSGATTTSYPTYAPPDNSYTASVIAVQCWTVNGWAACTAGNDTGVQQLTLQVASSDGATSHGATERLAIVVRKPCGPGSSCT